MVKRPHPYLHQGSYLELVIFEDLCDEAKHDQVHAGRLCIAW